MAIKTADFEKAFVSLQNLVDPIKLGYKMRIVADYDETQKHIKINYLRIPEETDPESIPDDLQFNHCKVNGGIDWKYGTLCAGSGGQNREFAETNLQSVLGLLGMCETTGKIRVIVDYDPDKEEIAVKHVTPAMLQGKKKDP